MIFILLFLFSSFLSPADAEVIGHSVEGRPIKAHTVGEGEQSVILVGGIHGGYEWNTIVLAHRILDHFRTIPDYIPSDYTLHVIPNMNPDGLYTITEGKAIRDVNMQGKNTVPGRFNARGVDLNRNWDHEWQPTSYWGRREVDAGDHPFSEPETNAVRDYILQVQPNLIVFFQSAANGIWYSGKQNQWAPARRFARAYSDASGYPLPEGTEGPVDYEITGSASGYLYTKKIPTLVIELATHHNVEFQRNLDGLLAVFDMLER